MSEELLADAIAAEKGLHVCQSHPQPVWYDEEKCPACTLMRELSKTGRIMYWAGAKQKAGAACP